MRKIKFEKSKNGFYTDGKIKNFRINIDSMVESVFNEIYQGTMRSIVDVFKKKSLYIVVPNIDENGNTVFEMVRAILTYQNCPQNLSVFDEYGRWWEIEENDVAFFDKEDAIKMAFFSNLIIILENKKNEMIEILQKSPIEVFGEENCPSYEECVHFAIKILAETENIIGFIDAAKKVIDEIGTENE